jgi:hypothetical protein
MMGVVMVMVPPLGTALTGVNTMLTAPDVL